MLALAAAYLVAGRLALLLAIPPGYATAVWPAAGIALAAMIIFGFRVWPSIWLGSFSDPTSGLPWTRRNAASILKFRFVGAGLGAGASLQAIVGAFLVRRFIGYPMHSPGKRRSKTSGAGHDQCFVSAHSA